MKYERLYKLAMEQGVVIFRYADYPQNIVQPTSGYGIFSDVDIMVPKNDTEAWDESLERIGSVTRYNGYKFIYVNTLGDLITLVPCDIVGKDFAAGYARGTGDDFIWDVVKQKEIRLR